MISVLIPTINDPYLFRTIESVRNNAREKVEFIVINDGGKSFELNCKDVKIIVNPTQRGRRVAINDAARMARGEYLFILDSHCSMSKDWDVKMKESVKDNNLVYCVIRDMKPDSWEYIPGDYLLVYMNKEYTEKWWTKKTLAQCDIEEESMCITGCAWMVTKRRYWQLNGYDENLGMYGWDGPEWSLKIQLSKPAGKVILRTDVICGHIFGTNNKNSLYPCKMINQSKYIDYMTNKWGRKINALVEHFMPVPGWHGKEPEMHVKEGTGREVKLESKREISTRNEQDVIIKKVIEFYEYIYRDDGRGPTPKEIKAKHEKDMKKVREEVWELKNNKLQKVA
jgi:glycosyltransferase involved in cell wall biosynthesis